MAGGQKVVIFLRAKQGMPYGRGDKAAFPVKVADELVDEIYAVECALVEGRYRADVKALRMADQAWQQKPGGDPLYADEDEPADAGVAELEDVEGDVESDLEPKPFQPRRRSPVPRPAPIEESGASEAVRGMLDT